MTTSTAREISTEVAVSPGQRTNFSLVGTGAFCYVYLFAKEEGGLYQEVPKIKPVRVDHLLLSLTILMKIDGRDPWAGEGEIPTTVLQPGVTSLPFRFVEDGDHKIEGSLYCIEQAKRPVTVKVLFRNEPYVVGPLPEPPLDKAFRRKIPTGKRVREYILGFSWKNEVSPGEVVDVISEPVVIDSFNPSKLYTVGSCEGFEILDIMVAGVSRLDGVPMSAARASYFSNEFASVALDLGSCKKGEQITLRVRNAIDHPKQSFHAAILGGVE